MRPPEVTNKPVQQQNGSDFNGLPVAFAVPSYPLVQAAPVPGAYASSLETHPPGGQPGYPPSHVQPGYPPAYGQQGYPPGYGQQGYPPAHAQPGYPPYPPTHVQQGYPPAYGQQGFGPGQRPNQNDAFYAGALGGVAAFCFCCCCCF